MAPKRKYIEYLWNSKVEVPVRTKHRVKTPAAADSDARAAGHHSADSVEHLQPRSHVETARESCGINDFARAPSPHPDTSHANSAPPWDSDDSRQLHLDTLQTRCSTDEFGSSSESDLDEAAEGEEPDSAPSETNAELVRF